MQHPLYFCCIDAIVARSRICSQSISGGIERSNVSKFRDNLQVDQEVTGTTTHAQNGQNRFISVQQDFTENKEHLIKSMFR